MNLSTYYIYILSFALFTCFSACESDTITELSAKRAGDCDKMGLMLGLSIPASLEIITTRANTTIAINDVWVVQYIAATSEGTSGQMFIHNYSGTAIATDADATTGLIGVTTGNTDFRNTDSRFYIIVNAGQEHSGLKALKEAITDESTGTTSKTPIDLTSLLVDITTEATAEPELLTVGPIEFKERTEGGSGANMSAAIVAHLQRAYAKVSVCYKVNPVDYPDGTFTATSVKVNNLPLQMAFYERAGAENGAYPILSTGTMKNIEFSGDLVPAVGSDLVFYIAENLRGLGIATTAQGKNQGTNGPLAAADNVRSLEGCTSVTLSGKYKYGSSYTGEIGVEYRFFLGGNLVNNYNVERGKAYKLDITIGGVNSADVRVTVTDGNVSVFDHVTVIPEIKVDL